MSGRAGAAVATLFSLGVRALGYLLFGVALLVYRRDPRMIVLIGGVVLAGMVLGLGGGGLGIGGAE